MADEERSLILPTIRDKVIKKMEDFESDNLTVAARKSLRSIEWEFVKLFVYLAQNFFKISRKQFISLNEDELTALADCVAERSEEHYRRSQSLLTRFLRFIGYRRNSKKEDADCAAIYFQAHSLLKVAYGKNYFPHSKFLEVISGRVH